MVLTPLLGVPKFNGCLSESAEPNCEGQRDKHLSKNLRECFILTSTVDFSTVNIYYSCIVAIVPFVFEVGSHYVDQYDLELRDPHASVSHHAQS